MMENKFKNRNHGVDGNKYKNNNSKDNPNVKNIKTIVELEKIIEKAENLGADAIGTYNNHTAVRIADRWYVPFLRKDQTPDDDPCLRPVSTFEESNKTSNDFGSRNTTTEHTTTSSRPSENNVQFESPTLGDKPEEGKVEKKEEPHISTPPKKNHDLKKEQPSKENPGFDSITPNDSEDADESDEEKRKWRKNKKKLL